VQRLINLIKDHGRWVEEGAVIGDK